MNHALLDGYLTFGVPEESRDDKQILAELKIAAGNLNRLINTVYISPTDEQ